MTYPHKELNFKVFQASAGSGKTFTIVKEYLKLCLVDKNAVDNFRHILAITFTNASANDMKSKIIKYLNEIIDNQTTELGAMETVLVDELGISQAELKHNATLLRTRIMHDYSSFCVSTIDAFVQKLSRAFASDLGLPSKYMVSIDDVEMAETVTQNIGLRISDKDDFLTRLLEDFSKNQFDNEYFVAIKDQLSEFIMKLMKEKAYFRDENNRIQNITQYRQTLDFLEGRLRQFEQGLRPYLDDFHSVENAYSLGDEDYSYGKAGFISFVRKLSRRDYEQPSKRFYEVLDKRSCFSKAAEKQLGKAQVEAVNAALLPILDALKTYYENGLKAFLFYRSQRDLLYLYALRVQIKLEFEQLAENEDVVHISEFNKLLNEVMGDFSVPFVYERIGEHFQHVFVDEYQDTSVLQWQNLLPLIDNGLAAGQMSMVVGDGKQSIYRFRSGEVGQLVSLPEIYARPTDDRADAFIHYEDRLKDNFDFNNLDTNRRSFANVVKFNNAFFEAAISGLSADSKKVYIDQKPNSDVGVSIQQKIFHQEEGLVQVELFDSKTQPDYCLERVEALIRELTEKYGYRYSDITVLTRRNGYGSEIANYLNNKGIPVISQVSILLKSSDRVQMMVNALRYLIYGDSEINVVNLLYYWNLLKHSDFKGDISHWFDEVGAIVRGDAAIETIMGLGEPGLLEDLLSKATCLYDLCASLMRLFHFDTIRDAFLNYFMEEVFKWESGTKEGIAEFLAFWDKKKKDLAVKSVSGNAVQITTIHKSKGLQYNVVIYPEAITNLDEKLNPRMSPEEWLRPQDLGFDPILNLDSVLFKMDKVANGMGDLAMEHIEKEAENNRLDNLNLLYVAFTRAVQRLYIIAKSDQPNLYDDFFKDEKSLELFETEETENCRSYRLGNPDFMKPAEKQTEEHQEDEMTDSVAADWFARIHVDPNPTLYWQSENDVFQPREWGNLVHSILSEIHTIADADKALRPYLLDGSIDSETAVMLKDQFMKMAQHPQIGAAFNEAAKVKNECELVFEEEDEHQEKKVVVRRPDRYAELPDVIYLLDYKTGKKDPEHHTQVQHYANAVKELSGKEIRAYLVYLSEDTIEVETI